MATPEKPAPPEDEIVKKTRGRGEARLAAPDDELRESPLTDDTDRIPLHRLSPVQAPVDLARTVPELIRRRSRGRFFGRKRLSDRLPLEWMSLGMLLLLAAIYAALKLLSPMF